MKFHTTTMFIVLISVAAFLMSGCAVQRLTVRTQPTDARVTVINGATGTPLYAQTAPKIGETMVTVRKNQRDVALRVDRDGYQSKQVRLERKTDPWFFGKLLLSSGLVLALATPTYGGAVSAGIGVGTVLLVGMIEGLAAGDIYKFEPSKVWITLSPADSSTTKQGAVP